jgi:hypothetical protein
MDRISAHVETIEKDSETTRPVQECATGTWIFFPVFFLFLYNGQFKLQLNVLGRCFESSSSKKEEIYASHHRWAKFIGKVWERFSLHFQRQGDFVGSSDSWQFHEESELSTLRINWRCSLR